MDGEWKTHHRPSTTQPHDRMTNHGRDARATMKRKRSDTRSRLQMDHAEAVRRGVRGAVRPLCNNTPSVSERGQGMGLRGSPTGARAPVGCAAAGSRRKNAPTIVPYPAGFPEPIVQVGVPPSRHGLSGRGPPWVVKGQGIAARPRTQQGHVRCRASGRGSPLSTCPCLCNAATARFHACALRTRAFSALSPATTANTWTP